MLSKLKSVISSLLICITFSNMAYAQVTVTRGDNNIPEAEATLKNDIVIKNNKLAFALAIDSAAPWGVPRGALVDLSVVENSEPRGDRIAFADFIPNSWSAWPNDGNDVEILTETSRRALVKISRNFGDVDISTSYSLKAGDDFIGLNTVMTNHGKESVTLNSGFTLWPDAGHMFAAPGLDKSHQRKASISSDRTLAYDQDWVFALHAPYFDKNVYEGRDMYKSHTLAPGESRSFTAQLQVVPDGDVAPVVSAETARRRLPTGTVRGNVAASNGETPEKSLVVVKRNQQLYAWTKVDNGTYEIDLPEGSYQVYGTALGHAQSQPKSLKVTKDSVHKVDFNDLAGPATLVLTIADKKSGEKLDGRISILEGQQSEIEFLGKRTFFTELRPAGKAKISLPPGHYKLGINAGAGFTSKQQTLSLDLKSGETSVYDIGIKNLILPKEQDWYGADLHHHGNILEAITPAEIVVRSQLAAGLDLVFISEHDSTINFKKFALLAKKRDTPFIPSIEISPSWGHINPFPVDIDATLSADPGTADIHTLMQAIADMGATVVAMNHPFNDYGYYANLEKGVVPGGKSDGFDLLELNAAMDNTATVNKAHSLWDKGIKMYFNAGTDTHDAWNQQSGAIRMMGHVPDSLTTKRYAQALKSGHSYATMGPILIPETIIFGDEVEAGTIWPITVIAVNGIQEIRMLGVGGRILQRKEITNGNALQKLKLNWKIPATAKGWVSIEAVDNSGKTARSNPVWILQ